MKIQISTTAMWYKNLVAKEWWLVVIYRNQISLCVSMFYIMKIFIYKHPSLNEKVEKYIE